MDIQLSVIICTYNRCESLQKTLESLFAQKGCEGISYEIIVVDNNSTDQTKSTVESFCDRFSMRLRYVFEKQQGLSFARNRGIKEAAGEIIAFTDDDVIVEKNWLCNINGIFKQYNPDAIGGRVIPIYPVNTPQWVKNNKALLLGPIISYDYGDSTSRYDSKDMSPFIGANMALKKNIFSKYGYFRTDIGAGSGLGGEDTELIDRIEKHKSNLLYYAGNVSVWHEVAPARMKINYIINWYIAAGRYAARVEMERVNCMLIFGMPRYAFRKMFSGACLIAFFFANNRYFVRGIKLFFINLGILVESRKQRIV